MFDQYPGQDGYVACLRTAVENNVPAWPVDDNHGFVAIVGKVLPGTNGEHLELNVKHEFDSNGSCKPAWPRKIFARIVNESQMHWTLEEHKAHTRAMVVLLNRELAAANAAEKNPERKKWGYKNIYVDESLSWATPDVKQPVSYYMQDYQLVNRIMFWLFQVGELNSHWATQYPREVSHFFERGGQHAATALGIDKSYHWQDDVTVASDAGASVTCEDDGDIEDDSSTISQKIGHLADVSRDCVYDEVVHGIDGDEPYNTSLDYIAEVAEDARHAREVTGTHKDGVFYESDDIYLHQKAQILEKKAEAVAVEFENARYAHGKMMWLAEPDEGGHLRKSSEYVEPPLVGQKARIAASELAEKYKEGVIYEHEKARFMAQIAKRTGTNKVKRSVKVVAKKRMRKTRSCQYIDDEAEEDNNCESS